MSHYDQVNACPRHEMVNLEEHRVGEQVQREVVLLHSDEERQKETLAHKKRHHEKYRCAQQKDQGIYTPCVGNYNQGTHIVWI